MEPAGTASSWRSRIARARHWTAIADIAFAVAAYGIKAGAPQPETDFPDPSLWVRRRKYLRLIEIEEREAARL